MTDQEANMGKTMAELKAMTLPELSAEIKNYAGCRACLKLHLVDDLWVCKKANKVWNLHDDFTSRGCGCPKFRLNDHYDLETFEEILNLGESDK